jgi:hypothetical protein
MIDLIWAVGLMSLTASLAVFVLLAFAPYWIIIPLALIVLATALPIEEFFQAHEEKHALREGIFFALSFLALVAQFWFGSIRGLFIQAFTHVDAGAASHALKVTAVILQYALGLLAVVSECMCGYKLYRVRVNLMSASARAVREIDQCDRRLVRIYAAIQSIKAQPKIRRFYRMIGARQYLACKRAGDRSIPQDPNAHHLRKAFIGSLVALFVLFVLLLLVRSTFADTGGKSIVAFCDLTKSVPVDEFQSNINAVTQLIQRLSSKDRLLILGITDRFGNPVILLDQTMPLENGYLNLGLQAAREQLSDKWGKMSKELLARRIYERTDLIGSLFLLQYLAGLPPGNTFIVVFSDLRQSTPELDLESVSQISTTKEIERLKRAKSIPYLKGYKVYLLGVDPNGKSPKYFASLKDFWINYFKEAGAEVRAFAIDRRLPVF